MSVNYIDQITDTAGTTHYIAEGVDTRIFTATCTTAAATAAKVATLDDATGFSLTTGVKVAVTFTYANTTTGTTTLNVNSTGAKNVVFYGDDEAGGYYTAGAIYNKWGMGETLIFTYNGTSWCHTPSQYFTDYTYKTLDNSKADKASPTFTGTPTAPTANVGTNTTQLATTAFVNTALTNKITYGTTDLTAGTSTLATGVIYLMCEVDS